MHASALGPVALWTLSMVPLLPGLESLSSGPSRLLLVASPWLFGAGIPRALHRRDTRPVANAVVTVALAVPPLALALRLDGFDEGIHPMGMSLVRLLCVVLFVFVLAAAAQRAASGVHTQRAHASAWFALVAIGPVLRHAWSLGAHHPAPHWLAAWASASPLEWLWLDDGMSRLPWPALTCAVLLALAFRAPEPRTVRLEGQR